MAVRRTIVASSSSSLSNAPVRMRASPPPGRPLLSAPFGNYNHQQASNSKGFKTRVQVAFPPEVIEIMAVVCSSRHYPEFNTPTAIIRYCTYLNLQSIIDGMNDPKVLALWDHVLGMEKALEEEEMNLKFNELIVRMNQTVNNCSDDKKYVAEFVMDLYNRAKRIPNTYWRNKYVRRIEKDFSKWIPRGERVGKKAAEDNVEEDSPEESDHYGDSSED